MLQMHLRYETDAKVEESIEKDLKKLYREGNAIINAIEILTSTDKPRQLPILKTSMQGNHHSNVNASQPQSYRLLDKLTNALKSKIMTRLV